MNGGQDNECKQVAQAFDSPDGSLNGLLFEGREDQINNSWTWSRDALFAFVVDANECQGQPKAVRVQLNVVEDTPVPFNPEDVDGGSATYCDCKHPD